MITISIALLFGAFLAYANGANDNFKGVATLFGSGTTDYQKALRWATLTTAAGSIVALFLATGLLKTFSGKGLVPDTILQTQVFPMSVAFASAFTVWLATRLGFPISTTHAITGALVGAGFSAAPGEVNLSVLGSSFFLPLLVSPFIALALAITLYPIFRWSRDRLGVEKETCVCVGTEVVARFPQGTNANQAISATLAEIPALKIGLDPVCREEYSGSAFGINARNALDLAHYGSAGAVCFARAVNDTPKIAAIVLVGQALSPNLAVVVVGFAMIIGGMVSARKVAETMSHRVTAMNAGQGFTANLVTSAVVIFASKFGVPVSTAHVSCGALFGIGTVNGQAHWKTIASILAAWLITLPVAAFLGGMGFFALRGLGL